MLRNWFAAFAVLSCLGMIVGCGDALPDADGDGVPDELDLFPNDPNESADTDADGIGDNADACPDYDDNACDRGNCSTGTCECDAGWSGTECDVQPWACTIQEAEHPSYTTVAQDVALCGNNYDDANIDTACNDGWEVCLESEWEARFPSNASPEGPLTTWGASQATRCTGDVWQADQPESDDTYSGEDVCDGPYNPWNDGKFLYDEDGTTILVGSGECCDWDETFSTTTATSGFAVYCCLIE